MADQILDRFRAWIDLLPPFVQQVVLPVSIAVVVGLIIHFILFFIARRVFREEEETSVAVMARKQLRRPTRYMIPLLAAMIAIRWVPAGYSFTPVLQLIIRLGLTAAIGWMVVSAWRAFRDHVISQHPIDVEDNLEARRAQTQMIVLHRVIVVIVTTVTFAIMLMSFPSASQIGKSLLASAGIIGLAVGIAARPVLSNLIAGVQIAMTQPIRLDDVVIVEGEWGRIEEITSTYVIVRIWDQRRLVVPINYFIDNPFQNWTRTTAEILGTVYLYVDYTVPVEEVRTRLKEILDENRLWNRKVWTLQVTSVTEQSVELRALMSASDASKAWDLRCQVREKLLAYVKDNWPESLPKTRAHIQASTPSLPTENGDAQPPDTPGDLPQDQA